MSKISALPQAAAPSGLERVVMVQAGRTVGGSVGGLVEVLAGPFTERAEDSAHRAELAAIAAILGKLYSTVAAGMAATADGGQFSVQAAGEEMASLYRRNGAVAVELGSYPSALAVSMRARIADLASAAVDKGAAMIGYNREAAYPEGTIGAAIRSVKAVSDDGIWDVNGDIEDDGEWSL